MHSIILNTNGLLMLQQMEVDDFSEKRKVELFIAIVGEDVAKWLQNLNVEEEKTDSEEKILKLFKDNLIEINNVIRDRFVFNTTLQDENNFDSFLSNLRKLVRKCDYVGMETTLVIALYIHSWPEKVKHDFYSTFSCS